jgi:hypothetical protein
VQDTATISITSSRQMIKSGKSQKSGRRVTTRDIDALWCFKKLMEKSAAKIVFAGHDHLHR